MVKLTKAKINAIIVDELEVILENIDHPDDLDADELNQQMLNVIFPEVVQRELTINEIKLIINSIKKIVKEVKESMMEEEESEEEYYDEEDPEEDFDEDDSASEEEESDDDNKGEF